MVTTTKILAFVLVTITTFTVLLGYCSGTVYKVGDSDGWTAKDAVYYDWAEGKEFHVGDSLVFQYDPNYNDVTQVSGALEYEFCDSSSPKAVYKTGHDVVTLTEPGFHHFISSNRAQCELGQKLDVLVVHDPSRPIPPPPPPSVDDSDYYHFHVGDNLLFEYANEIMDVLEISDYLEFMYLD